MAQRDTTATLLNGVFLFMEDVVEGHGVFTETRGREMTALSGPSLMLRTVRKHQRRVACMDMGTAASTDTSGGSTRPPSSSRAPAAVKARFSCRHHRARARPRVFQEGRGVSAKRPPGSAAVLRGGEARRRVDR